MLLTLMTKQDSWAPPLGNRNLEEAFFLKEDQLLIEKLATMKKMQETKQALAEVSGIKNDEVLAKLISLGVSTEVVASLAVIPLIEVAWADGHVDEKEREAVLRSLREAGVPESGLEFALVQSWLNHKPGANLLEAWQHYVRHLCAEMNPSECAGFKEELLKSTRAIAEASGGFAGLRKVSSGERDMLEKLQQTFR